MRRLCSFLACAVLTLSAATAQTASEPFGEVIDVRVVNVEVVVTDRDGNRVQGLKPGDFRLRVDGKDVPVEFFTEIHDRQAVAPPSEETPAGPVAVSPGETVGTSYLVFIDDYFTVPARRNEVLKALGEDLSRLGPKDRMAVVSFDGARLTRLSGWTGSAAELRQALDKAASVPARGIDRITELRSYLQSEQLLSDVVDDPGGRTTSTNPTQGDPINQRTVATGIAGQQVTYGLTLASQIESGVAAVVSAMRGAGTPPGRKVLLLLAGSWPFSIQSFLLGNEGLISSSRQLPDGEKLLRPLTSTANLLGYTIYPVDVAGIESEAASAASFAGSGTNRMMQEQEVHGTFLFLAEETGGRPLLNTSRTAVLETAEADTRSYYWLGFTPSWQRNDKSHKIAVEPLRPGLRVRARTNFLDMSRDAEVEMIVESALMLGDLPGAIPMPMRLGKPVKLKGNEVEIPVTLALPVDALTVVQVNGQYTSRLELRAAVSDAKGNRSNVPSVPLTLSSEKQPRPGRYVRYETRIILPSSARHLVVAVFDPLNGKVSTAEAELDD